MLGLSLCLFVGLLRIYTLLNQLKRTSGQLFSSVGCIVKKLFVKLTVSLKTNGEA